LSVEKQTYKKKEIIVINDGSTDKTESIILEFISNSSLNIKLFTTTNKGGSCAKNLGIKKSTGELIAFLDADDIWLPQKLEKQVKLMTQNSKVIGVGCGYKKFTNQSNSKTSLIKFSWDQNSMMAWMLLEGDGPGFNSTILLKRELVEELNGFDESIDIMADDLDLAWRIFQLGEIIQEKSCLAELRTWEGQNYRNIPKMEKALLTVYNKHFTKNSNLLNLATSNLSVWIGLKYLLRGQLFRGLGKILRGIYLSQGKSIMLPLKLIAKWRKSRVSDFEA